MRVAVWLFLCFLALYISTAKAVFEYGDDVSMLQVTQAIVERRSLNVEPCAPGSKVGMDGYCYSKYGLGQSLLGIPFYVVGKVLLPLAPVPSIVDERGLVRAGTIPYLASLLGTVSTAGAVALLYALSLELGFSRFGAVAAAFSLGLGTFAWHYSRTFMSEPTSLVVILLSFYSALRFRNGDGAAWLALSGVGSASSFLLRSTNAAAVAVIACWILWEMQVRRQGSIRWMLINMGVWAAPVLVSLVVFFTYNLMRFGSPWETGYGSEAGAFTTPFYVGLYGFILSPGKSLFIYAPITLAGVVGWFYLRRTQPIVASVILALVLAYLLLYSRYYAWYGGGAWGPRFLVPILPFVTVGVAALVEGRRTPTQWIALLAIALASLFVQVCSILVPYVPYEAKMEATPELFERLLWHPAYSPVLATARSLLQAEYPLDVAPTYYSSAALAWLQLGALVVAVLLVLGGIAKMCLGSMRRSAGLVGQAMEAEPARMRRE
mgnify:CR=1 FL=1